MYYARGLSKIAKKSEFHVRPMAVTRVTERIYEVHECN